MHSNRNESSIIWRQQLLEKYFMLFSNCVPVKGVKRSIIYDLERQTYDYIPNGLYTILKKFKLSKISEIYQKYSDNDHYIIDEYMRFLIEKEYVFITDNQEELLSFPSVKLEWDSPAIITNAIIDIASSKIDLKCYLTVLKDLDDLGCQYLELRIWGSYNLLGYYKGILECIEELNIISVDLLIPSLDSFLFKDYYDLETSYSKINRVIIYNCSDGLLHEINNNSCRRSSTKITGVREMISNQVHCGVVGSQYFTVNTPLFTESMIFNSCLNRKIGIDQFGNIKNCPSSNESFGEIQKDRIKEVILKPAFTRLWFVGKDQINTCKVCEFRYMCTDCRVFVEHEFGKPAKCDYNPFTCEWGDNDGKKRNHEYI